MADIEAMAERMAAERQAEETAFNGRGEELLKWKIKQMRWATGNKSHQGLILKCRAEFPGYEVETDIAAADRLVEERKLVLDRRRRAWLLQH